MVLFVASQICFIGEETLITSVEFSTQLQALVIDNIRWHIMNNIRYPEINETSSWGNVCACF